MKIRILGSGGYLRIPRACCQCKICNEARLKGYPYKRLGTSIYIEDEKILIDTPEDINEELNREKINGIRHLIYSHWHPDHTNGWRIVEAINSLKNSKKPPIIVHVNKELNNSLKQKVPGLYYMEQCGFIRAKEKETFKINSISIKPIRLGNNIPSFAYLIECKGKKMLYCADHSKDIPLTEDLMNLDLLIMNLGHFNGFKEIKNTGFVPDNLRIINKLKPKMALFTHIEEKWNKNYDDYIKLEKKHKSLNIRFAFDGMRLEI